MDGGFDEACGADLAAVAEGRSLGPADAAWLARAVAGAVRPSRDRPAWDLAHAAAAIGPGRVLDLLLDARLASPARARAAVAGAPSDDRGLVLEAPRPWRCSWAGLARLLALGEFLLTADALARFGEVAEVLGGIAGPEDAAEAGRRLASLLGAYRREHMPLASVERRFAAIRAHLGGRRDFGDDDVVAVWRTGEEALFVTVVDHFITFARVSSDLDALQALGGAARLGDLEGWEDRLEAATLPACDEPALDGALLLLAESEGPKLLTGAERDALRAVLRLDPFHRARPLTALRALAFGRVQSGIANRLRRGGGGADVGTRVLCEEADYAAHAAQAEALLAHLRRCLAAALALRGAGGPAIVAEGERALRSLRRAGFDAPREALAAAVAAVDGALATVTFEMDAHRAALARLGPLEAPLARDRALFSDAFAALYLGGAP